MEFGFSINSLFPSEISCLDADLTPFKSSRHRGISAFTEQVRKVVDVIGEASAKAQGLKMPITSATRVSTSDHHLYLLKDEKAFAGKGAVNGFLKVGFKRLFILDLCGAQHQVTPLCVLDFYVHETQQRMGLGKMLFQHMLTKEEVQPQHLAIDRPSNKFLKFLNKHYNLHSQIPQVNNFVVFDGFFDEKPAQTVGLFPYKSQYSDMHKELSIHSASDIPLTAFEKSHQTLQNVALNKSRLQKGTHISSPFATDSGTLYICRGPVNNQTSINPYSRYSVSPFTPGRDRFSADGAVSKSPDTTIVDRSMTGKQETVDITGSSIKINVSAEHGDVDQSRNADYKRRGHFKESRDDCKEWLTSPSNVHTDDEVQSLPEIAGERRYEDLSKDTSWKIFGTPAGTKTQPW